MHEPDVLLQYHQQDSIGGCILLINTNMRNSVCRRSREILGKWKHMQPCSERQFTFKAIQDEARILFVICYVIIEAQVVLVTHWQPAEHLAFDPAVVL